MIERTLLRTISAKPDKVWDAWTDPEAIRCWLWPAELELEPQIDLRPHGHYRFYSPVANAAVSGEFLTVRSNIEIVQTWHWEYEAAVSMLTVTFDETEKSGTCLRLTHDRFETEVERMRHMEGWAESLERLATYLYSAAFLPAP